MLQNIVYQKLLPFDTVIIDTWYAVNNLMGYIDSRDKIYFCPFKTNRLVDDTFGVPEYWIVDYLALGGRRYIGNPKQPTISVYYLVDGEYQVNLFRGSDHIISPTFPELNLTAEQIFQAGRSQNQL